MDHKEYFINNVLQELLTKTKWIRDNFTITDNRDKAKRWRCLSCDQLCECKIHQITLLDGRKMWELNVDNVP